MSGHARPAEGGSASAAPVAGEGPQALGGGIDREVAAQEVLEGGETPLLRARGDDALDDVAIPVSCTGECTKTSLEAAFGAKKGSLDRAQFGTSEADGGAESMHVEAHFGGATACPDENSPTPDRTLVVSGVPRASVGKSFSRADGISAAFFDFKNDFDLPPLTKASSVVVKVIAEDGAPTPAWVAMDVEATFPEGTVTGHIYAEFCDSLSD